MHSILRSCLGSSHSDQKARRVIRSTTGDAVLKCPTSDWHLIIGCSMQDKKQLDLECEALCLTPQRLFALEVMLAAHECPTVFGVIDESWESYHARQAE